MAVKEFNCNKIKRTFWPITLKDKEDGEGNKTPGRKLVVRMPQKGVFEAIKSIPDTEEATAEDTDKIYSLLAAVLSNNMTREKVTVADLADYDVEECVAIINAYMEFVDELASRPN